MNEICIGLIGHKGIGKQHSHGYRSVRTYFDLDLLPILKVICGRNENAVIRAAKSYGWEEWSTDWREVLRRDDIDLIDICVPNYLHCEIAIKAAETGKDIICEKPLGRNFIEALEMLRVVHEKGVKHMTAFVFRCVPAIRLAKELINAGEIGEIQHWRARWLGSWFMDPSLPLSWNFQKEKAGSGASGDLGSHLIDLAHYLVGEIKECVGLTKTFVKERSVEASSTIRKHVDVDDATQFIVRFKNGAIGSFEANRFAGGHQEEFDIEISGNVGSVYFNSHFFNKLYIYSSRDTLSKRGVKTIFVGNKQHPYGENISPYGEIIGRNDLFIIQSYELLNALKQDINPTPSFYEGAQCQAVIEAVLESARERRWIEPDYAKIR